MAIELKVGMREDAFEVRRRVFMDEQGYENEFDAIDDDPSCLHITLYVDGELAGCARAFPASVERALTPDAPCPPACSLDEGADLSEVSEEELGIMEADIFAACEAGAKVCKLHAQEYVRDLYAKLGYIQISDVDYEDEGQPHLWMAKRLS